MLRCVALLLFSVVLIPLAVLAQSASEVISAETANQVVEIATLFQDGATNVEWSPDNHLLAVASLNGVWLYDPAALQSPPRLLGARGGPVSDMGFSPDGSLLAAASGSIIHIWDVALNSEIQSFSGSEPIAFSPDGRYLAHSAGGTVMRLWDLEAAQDQTTFSEHTDRVTDVIFSANSMVVVTTSMDTTLRIWDSASGRQFGFQRSRRRPQLSASFSPNGALIASGTRRGMVRILNVAVDTERSFGLGHSSDVRSVMFSPVVSLLAFGLDNTVQLWDINPDNDPIVLNGHSSAVIDLTFSPDGTRLATVGQDGTILMWGIR
jgi:WD40 repeat protein